MNKIIWSCWFQGRENAPLLVRRCLDSWERKNPTFRFRCLDAASLQRYVPLARYLDLDRQSLTAASLSDVLRVLLLHEFGGVWVDATLLCNRSLDEWLPGVMEQGFFAFSAPASDRPLSSWFLSAETNSTLMAAWCRRVLDYWKNRNASDDYFWLHHLFREMIETEAKMTDAWSRVPQVSADGPHALQNAGAMYLPRAEIRDAIDWTTPVFKLTHRLPEGEPRAGSMLEALLSSNSLDAARPAPPPSYSMAPQSFASLKVSTENLGDHVQVLSCLDLLRRIGITPTHYLDRDTELASAPGLTESTPMGIVLNGWFKSNRTEWPPHSGLSPLFYSFHIRLFQCPELVSEDALNFYRRHQPIGCRDPYTEALLRSRGIEAFTSHCLSLTLPRRTHPPEQDGEVFVVSRDRRLKDYVPLSVGPNDFISHYSGSGDFAANMGRAEMLLEIYRSRAKLIVTTLLHCALPAMAMGIPVVVFYPLNTVAGHASDEERFSSLSQLIRIHRLEDIEDVDWNPAPVDVSGIKLRVLEGFFEMATRWRLPSPQSVGPIAPSSTLPAPG